jgi:predicted ABC-type ATPase
MLNRINDLLDRNESFAFETTLATRSYRTKIEEAKKKGYTTTLLFFWLQNVALAKERVKIRVAEGGHNIEPEVIERRYRRGIENLFEIYLPCVDGALIYDNSVGKHKLLAQKAMGEDLVIADKMCSQN